MGSLKIMYTLDEGMAFFQENWENMVKNVNVMNAKSTKDQKWEKITEDILLTKIPY